MIAKSPKAAGYATGLFGKWHLGGAAFGPQEQGFDVLGSRPANTEPTLRTGGKGEFAITAAAEQFIEENRDRPFFCYVPHNNPHIPLAAAPELTKRIATRSIRVRGHDRDARRRRGWLMAKVETLGLTDRTIFLFTSDNGGLHVLDPPALRRRTTGRIVPARAMCMKAVCGSRCCSLAGRRGGGEYLRNAARPHRPRPHPARSGRC